MEYCYTGTERLWCGSWNRHVCRKGKCVADRQSRSTRVNPNRKQRWERDWLLNVTCNGISFYKERLLLRCIHHFNFFLYMWRHIDMQADWRKSWNYSRAPNAIYFLYLLTCPSKHRHEATLFTVIPRHRSINSASMTHWRYRGPILILNPGVPMRKEAVVLLSVVSLISMSAGYIWPR